MTQSTSVVDHPHHYHPHPYPSLTASTTTTTTATANTTATAASATSARRPKKRRASTKPAPKPDNKLPTGDNNDVILDPLQLLTLVVTDTAAYARANPSSLTTSTLKKASLKTKSLTVSSSGSAPTTKTTAAHICTMCGSTFGRRCELKRHVSEVHTAGGARRFRCSMAGCGKSFTRKDALVKHHAVKHQGKRRFVCETCNEKFTSRYDLSRHTVRVHSNVKKRFTCEFCAAGFSQKSQLTMHKGRVHSDKVDKPKPEPGQQADGADKSTQALSPIDSLAAAAAMVQAQAQAQNEFESSPTRASVDMCRMSDAVKGQNKSPSKQDETSAESGADKLLQAAEALHPGNDRVSSEDDTEVPDCPRAPKRKRVDNSGGAEPGSSISEVETEMECDTRTEVTASTMVADGDEGTNEVDEDGNEDEWRSCES